ncbi:hypothetical protein MES5069_360140 [Mesorhizobium escarrei]|uniref:Secreted protein n=1 Tax=Mesorhizobium escarrei TaxID=666018 RepID=A0ABM9E1W8_9HYPH|nr:hypothetical protein MES5069_360140 [Mesorhizobium escarrei]
MPSPGFPFRVSLFVPLAARRVGIVAVAVALGNPAVLIVDFEFGLLVAAYAAPVVHRLALGVEVPRRPFAAAEFDVPASGLVRHHMMCAAVSFACHMLISFVSVELKVRLLRTCLAQFVSVVKHLVCCYSELINRKGATRDHANWRKNSYPA